MTHASKLRKRRLRIRRKMERTALLNRIVRASPLDTPLFQMMRRGPIEWFQDTLPAPGRAEEGRDYREVFIDGVPIVLNRWFDPKFFGSPEVIT